MVDRKEFLRGVIATAWIDAIDYWLDEETTQPDITMKVIAKGIAKIRAGTVEVNDQLRDTILLADLENDAGYIGSEEADVIVQVGLFGDIVYC
jgi:hypothetical protein